jgi:hypothetical protein
MSVEIIGNGKAADGVKLPPAPLAPVAPTTQVNTPAFTNPEFKPGTSFSSDGRPISAPGTTDGPKS